MSGKACDAVGKWEPGQMGQRFGVQFKDFLGWKDEVTVSSNSMYDLFWNGPEAQAAVN